MGKAVRGEPGGATVCQTKLITIRSHRSHCCAIGYYSVRLMIFGLFERDGGFVVGYVARNLYYSTGRFLSFTAPNRFVDPLYPIL